MYVLFIQGLMFIGVSMFLLVVASGFFAGNAEAPYWLNFFGALMALSASGVLAAGGLGLCFATFDKKIPATFSRIGDIASVSLVTLLSLGAIILAVYAALYGDTISGKILAVLIFVPVSYFGLRLAIRMARRIRAQQT